ncbi:MAG: hypothetical protein IT359_17905 [Gemmatimonadaceae bacterium]|nr:hypothetical protein [Gemmatimonadaceae bacterium]
MLVVLAGACVTTTTREWLPSPANPTYTAASSQPVLAEYVRLQCAALRKAQHPDTGSARFVVDVDTAGRATRAQVVRATPDELLDGVFGTVAAQLRFPAAPRARREPVDIAYRCDGDQAHVTVTAATAAAAAASNH